MLRLLFGRLPSGERIFPVESEIEKVRIEAFLMIVLANIPSCNDANIFLTRKTFELPDRELPIENRVRIDGRETPINLI